MVEFKGGYQGKLLRIDLTSKRAWIEDLNPDYVYPVIGEAGLEIKLLYDGVKSRTDPFFTGNKLIFSVDH